MPALSFSHMFLVDRILLERDPISLEKPKRHTTRPYSPKRITQFENNPTIQLYYKQRTKMGFKFAESQYLRTDGITLNMSPDSKLIESISLYALVTDTHIMHSSMGISNYWYDLMQTPRPHERNRNYWKLESYSPYLQNPLFKERYITHKLTLISNYPLNRFAINDGFKSFHEMEEFFTRDYTPEELSQGFMLIQWNPDSVVPVEKKPHELRG